MRFGPTLFSGLIWFRAQQSGNRDTVPSSSSPENVPLNANVLLFEFNNLMKLSLKWSALSQGRQNNSIRRETCCDRLV